MRQPLPSSQFHVLLIGPVVDSSYVGGLPLALSDLADQLRSLGWNVDAPLYTRNPFTADPTQPFLDLQTTNFYSRLSQLQRFPLLLALRQMVSPRLRQTIATLFMPRRYFANISTNLRQIEMHLKERGAAYDVVLICADGSPPGLVSLVHAYHSRVAVISLAGLALELQAIEWGWIRPILRWFRRVDWHAFLFRRVQPGQIRCAIFASSNWQQAARQAGLARVISHCIYFGIPLGPPLPHESRIEARLLYVGRLAPEKGLHYLIEALPMLRIHFPNVCLTAVAGAGPSSYRRGILARIRELNLESIVSLRPSVPREQLPLLYASHDILYFHSIFSEPVALVLMEAYAAGIPVVANQVAAKSDLIQDSLTCVCYQTSNPESLVRAITRLSTDLRLRTLITDNAKQLVQEKYSLVAMGEAYSNLLRQFAISSVRE